MRGHVAKKGNRYYAVIYEGSDPKTGRTRYRWVSDIPLVEVVGPGEWSVHRPLKRALDLAGATLLLALAAPALAACALAVRLTSPGPVLYRQERVGQGQRPFTLLKLRTMRLDAEQGA